MSTVTLPGFTGECALSRSRGHYLADMRTTHNPQVVPQMSYGECIVTRFSRTYDRCTAAGYGYNDCWDVAVDLANFICGG
jgi:hypothetical protein